MSIKLAKKAIVGAVGIAALSAGAANATLYVEEGSSAPQTLSSAGTVTATFAGLSDLTQPIFGVSTTLTCYIELEGELTEDPAGTVQINVTGGSVDTDYPGTSGLCSIVSFDTSPSWYATTTSSTTPGLPAANVPGSATDSADYPGIMRGVAVNVAFPGHNCSGDVAINYSNNGTGMSYFDFNNASLSPDCTVDGKLSSTPDDINVWDQ